MPLIPRLASGRFRPECLFHPASVAVIGAGCEAGVQVMGNLVGGGFSGAILPVAAGLGSVSGVPAYPDVAALPIAPDLAMVCAEAADIPGIFADLGKRGTHAAVVTGIVGGLRGLAMETGVRSLGPGSFGVSVPSLRLNASRAHLQPRPGRIALVSQSAALCRAVLDWAEPNGVGFSHIIGIGGNDDIGFGIVLDWLSRDPGTGAILLDIRRLKDRRAFLSAARAAARLRPMMAIRAGGLLMDPSGDADATLVAALRRCGILCVATLDDLLAAAETLTRSRPARGEALAIVTNAIGPAWMKAFAPGGPTQAHGRYVARRPIRVSRNSHDPGTSDAKCCAQPTPSRARKSADVRNGFPSKAPQRSTYRWLESPWAAAEPDHHPVSKAFRIPDPVNGSTKPSASPAG